MARQDGYSVLEVMIAMAVLGVGLLGATSGQVMAMKLSTTSRHAVLAMQLAEEQMETLQSIASCNAVSMLPGLARPLPASSNAVPWSTEVRIIGSPSVTFTARPKPRCFNTGSP